jgi:hypothetical protein
LVSAADVVRIGLRVRAYGYVIGAAQTNQAPDCEGRTCIVDLFVAAPLSVELGRFV